MSEFSHIPVLAKEVIDGLNIEKNKVYVDGTLGGAGHSKLILEQLSGTGTLLSFDQDGGVIEKQEEENQKFSNWTLVHDNFEAIADYCKENDIKIDGGLLLDLGLSSIQLDDPERGFSFFSEGPLDMRLNPDAQLDAETVVNKYNEKELADIIFEYGEERKSRQIASAIVRRRPISTCNELAKIIESCYARSYKKNYFKTHPATKTFQALRIYVNRELKVLEEVLKLDPEVYIPGARIAIISFHSLEDRIVKNAFRDNMRLKILSKKPIEASEEEMKLNPRSRSAKLRIAEVV